MIKNLIFVYSFVSFFTLYSEITYDHENSMPFSFSEIQKISVPLKEPSYIITADGCSLAYYSFMPAVTPKAIVIFYNGAGLYGNAFHQWIGSELAKNYGIGTYIMDIRGHGNSGGARGDAPSIESVFEDISHIITQVRNQYPHMPIFLSGHSSGAGLLLNYAAWNNHLPVNGLILLAPYLGPLSGTLKEHTDPQRQFAKKIRSWVYIVAGMTQGWLCAHTPAVYFNYPDIILEDRKVLRYYTYTMSCATTPYHTKQIFQQITIPTAFLIAEHDEQFIAQKLVDYADCLPTTTPRFVELVKEARHLTILLQAPQLIANMVTRMK